MLRVMNVFVKQILPRGVIRRRSEEEMAAYAARYPTVASRKPVCMWPQEIPIDGRPAAMHEIGTALAYWYGGLPPVR
jgi:haloalkane dehalogenase